MKHEMKHDKKNRPMSSDPQSILNTNSARMSTEPLEDEIRENDPARKSAIVSTIVILCVIVAIIAAVVLAAVLSPTEETEDTPKEDPKDVAADTIYINGDEPELLAHRVTWSGIQACYSNENGMYITMNFANGHEVAVPVTEINVWLKRGDELIASGRVRNIVDLVIPAVGDVDYQFYLDPSLVKITDLEEDIDVTWEFEITCEVDEEAQQVALEKRDDALSIKGEEPTVKANEVTYAVTEAYHTNEGGMYVTLGFANGTDTVVDVKELAVKLYTSISELEEKLLVADDVFLVENGKILVGKTQNYTIYFDPDTMDGTILKDTDPVEWEIKYKAE